MGNKINKLEIYSDIRKSLVPQSELYKIIGLKGDGILVDLIAQDSNNVDAYIKQEVGKLLFNNGAGKLVELNQLINVRSPSSKILSSHGPISSTKYVCFDIQKRGAFGETLLHLCFSNGSKIHMKLAKRLLGIYPHMINDIYLGNEYYGMI